MASIKSRATKAVRSLTLAMSANDMTRFRRIFARMHPHDRAKYFFSQKPYVRARLYKNLTPAETADLFEDTTTTDRADYLKEMTPSYAAKMLAAMQGDDAVDVLSDLSTKQINRYLALMDDSDEFRLRDLARHEEGTAGSIMTTDFVSISEDDTAKQAIDKLVHKADVAVTIYYAFVVDATNHLTGVLSLRTLLTAKPNTKVGDLEKKRVVSIFVGAHEEKAAKIIKDYDFLALPVVDDENHLIGIITVDDIVDVLHEAAVEDYSKMAAIADVELSLNPFVNLRKRLPWLSLLLFLGLITATLISQFEDTIAKVAILGAFIPVVAGTTGNSGTQALAVVVRALATGELEKISIRRHFLTEAGTALMMSVLCGLILAGIIFFWQNELFIGIVAGSALGLSIFVGTLVGSAVPLFMHKLKIDPAVASGPLITTICDIISMFVYFTIATAFMGYLI